ncbi:hemolysin-III related-domain-containing protein [Scheffersomyces amazonensis]|uniref:hemolysin-III related-domain-containing protein n=1 Tax=Scheffersomyces amazonensis TaxID=1078765 RepID=UPI00315C7F92
MTTQTIGINSNDENVLLEDDFIKSYNEENKASFRNRLKRSSFVQASIGTEELLVEKLDSFLSSIESRLDSFESFFKFNSKQEKGNEKENVLIPNNDYYLTTDRTLDPYLGATKTRRRSSSASFSTIKNYSARNLNLIHQRLNLIKESVLKNSLTNLEFLYKTLDDQYNYLFNPGEENAEDDYDSDNYSNTLSPTTSGTANRKELLSRKIIKTIQYFDEKLLQIDDFIKVNQPDSKIDYDQDSSLAQLRFYNFNKTVKAAEKRYVHYYELPLSWRENKYIIHGYRFSLSHRTLMSSIFKFNHNETMNIWSHMVGFFIFLYICFVHYPQSDVYKMNSFQDNCVMYLFLAAAIKCLVSSVTWHTYSGCAHLSLRSTCACVDYTGITVLITCSIIAVEYCSLYSYPKLLTTYMVFSCASGVGGLLFNWSPYFDRPECRSVRIFFFVGLAILGASSALCKWFYDGMSVAFYFFSPLFYKSFLWYWIGVIFYGGLIPERWRYDVIIEENNNVHNCEHNYDSIDVLTDNIEKSGEEEFEEIEEEIEEIIDKRDQSGSNSDDKLKSVIDKHFPEEPILSPYHKEFFSLWWVDYFMASHNIWHICVVLGVLGHYVCVLEMFRQIARQ